MNYLKNFSELINKKKGLLRCIFTTLLIQFIVTTIVFIIIYKFKIFNPYTINYFILFIFLIFSIGLITLMVSPNLKFYQRFALFTIFSITEGIFLSFCLKLIDVNIILSALVSTIMLFLVMLIFGFGAVFYKIDLSWLGIILFLLLVMLIFIYIVRIFAPYSSTTNQGLVVFALLLFSVYIIYDTNMILLRYNNKNPDRDCIMGALDYYLDLVNIFVNMISAFNR
uniref:Uncharacterized protein n=1 Tax=Florenciella sp. virus SA2 TaxID=3240092 RepID=A0AB39JB05_9VIRU